MKLALKLQEQAELVDKLIAHLDAPDKTDHSIMDNRIGKPD